VYIHALEIRAMKKLELMIVCWFVAVLLTSCTDDELSEMYSNRGVGKDKAALESSVQKVNAEIVELGKTDFALIGHSMMQELNGAEMNGNALFVQKIIEIGDLMYQANCSDCLFEELLNLAFASSAYCQPLLNEGCGVWRWNQGEFVKERDHQTDIVFMFPVENMSAEVAALTISDIVIYKGSLPGNDDQKNGNQTVEKLNFNLKLGDELTLSGNVKASFSDEGFYQDLALSFNPQPYNISYDLGKSADSGYWFSSFSRESVYLMDQSMDLFISSDESDMPVKSFVNQFLMYDVIVETKALTDNLYYEIKELADLDESSEQYVQGLVSALNAHAIMTVKYRDDRSIIAKVNAEPRKDSKGNWLVDLEMEFNDGSRISCNEYFDDYLVKFKVQLEGLIEGFENKFGI
jgi:hypothetical protein